MVAGFADDPAAHEAWEPRTLDSRTVDLWMGGELPPGVELGLGDGVEIVGGPLRGQRGSVIALLALEPEPWYLVELGSGEEVRVRIPRGRRTGRDGLRSYLRPLLWSLAAPDQHGMRTGRQALQALCADRRGAHVLKRS